ncbi:unnamed protein product [Caretta caretta]
MATSTQVSGLSLPYLLLILLLEIPGRGPLASPTLWIGLFLKKALIAAFLLVSFLSTMSKGYLSLFCNLRWAEHRN